jgi:hypothetical protein
MNGTSTPEAGSAATAADPERLRLADMRDHAVPWQRWGPYLADRQWGTVREDYSADGAAWRYFPHDHARSRAYRWMEDGLLGISDDRGLLCFGLVLWNGADPILKERLFGLTGEEGNHGEDVKECYFYLDSTPTHAYMRALYKYPQAAFPYADLVAQNRRGRNAPEYELRDTGVFDDDRYFDVGIEYAKAAPDDLSIRIAATNRGPQPAPLHVLPTLWFRNTWSWGRAEGIAEGRPELCSAGPGLLLAQHPQLSAYWLACSGAPELLFTENESNARRLWGRPNPSPYVKDGIHEAVVQGRRDAVNPAGTGTKAAAHYVVTIAAGATVTLQLRLSACRHATPFVGADDVFAQRRAEADRFYAPLAAGLSADERLVQRQAFAGLLWSKQLYHFDVGEWLEGDPGCPPPPQRRQGRNRDWQHFNSQDILSMPDTWEYPWFAAWDLAFHCIPLALIDP